jgi:hypothetical protein
MPGDGLQALAQLIRAMPGQNLLLDLANAAMDVRDLSEIKRMQRHASSGKAVPRAFSARPMRLGTLGSP